MILLIGVNPMIKAILLDCGGVIVAPATGDWGLPPEAEDVLGEKFTGDRLEQFRRARRAHMALLPDLQRVGTDEAEYALYLHYYAAVFEDMGLRLSGPRLEKFAALQTYRDDRYVLFGDVLSHLSAWRGRYKLGIVSDAPPSTRRIMTGLGVMAYMDGATFSCDLGVIKPDPRIYRRTLDLLRVAPEEAVFVDDSPVCLAGAEALGIRGIQMIRIMPDTFLMPPVWEGPVARSFYALHEMLETL
ncbi:MAG: HAD-IA family hydrolase [Firmicutes bacterium]|nr:HAD-IA family hydrolase [Bacillota bacterium]